MCRRTLALKALRALEVAARHRSLTKAAEELAVTPAAVHHQVKSLEALLGIRLLVRSGNGIVLTHAASAALPTLEAAFDLLSLATEKIRNHADGGVLSLACCPAFAQKWLLPRLGRFREDFAGIELRITSAVALPDLTNSKVDVAIGYGMEERHRSPSVSVERLLDDALLPVCTAEYCQRYDGLKTEGELLGGILLHDDGALAEQGADWESWLSAGGLGPSILAEAIRFDSAILALDAALAGQGIALARRSLVSADIVAGRLVQPARRCLPVLSGYLIAHLDALADHPRIVAFREWLFAEVSGDQFRLLDDRDIASPIVSLQ